MRLSAILAGLALLLVTSGANAGGSVSFGFSYHSGPTVVHPAPTIVQHGANVVIHQYPSGRVVVERYPVTHVYPGGVSLHQQGRHRVYTRGYDGPGTCYVECFHQGVRGGGHHRGYRHGGGTSVQFGVGIHHRR